MLGLVGHIGTIGPAEKMEVEPCQPDPERMLQGARERREKVELDISNFESMNDYWFPDAEKVVIMIYGAMHKALKEAEQDESFWLMEIDKGSE